MNVCNFTNVLPKLTIVYIHKRFTDLTPYILLGQFVQSVFTCGPCRPDILVTVIWRQDLDVIEILGSCNLPHTINTHIIIIININGHQHTRSHHQRTRAHQQRARTRTTNTRAHTTHDTCNVALARSSFSFERYKFFMYFVLEKYVSMSALATLIMKTIWANSDDKGNLWSFVDTLST